MIFFSVSKKNQNKKIKNEKRVWLWVLKENKKRKQRSLREETKLEKNESRID